MQRLLSGAVFLLAATLQGPTARAQTPTPAIGGPNDCLSTLVTRQRAETTTMSSERRLLRSITEEQWLELRANRAANVEVYGVPLGASFDDFQKNINRRHENLHFHERDEFHQTISESDLSSAAAEIYRMCLDRQRNSPYLTVESVGDDLRFWFVFKQLTAPPRPLRLALSVVGDGLSGVERAEAELRNVRITDRSQQIPFLIRRSNPYREAQVEVRLLDRNRIIDRYTVRVPGLNPVYTQPLLAAMNSYSDEFFSIGPRGSGAGMYWSTGCVIAPEHYEFDLSTPLEVRFSSPVPGVSLNVRVDPSRPSPRVNEATKRCQPWDVSNNVGGSPSGTVRIIYRLKRRGDLPTHLITRVRVCQSAFDEGRRSRGEEDCVDPQSVLR